MDSQRQYIQRAINVKYSFSATQQTIQHLLSDLTLLLLKVF